MRLFIIGVALLFATTAAAQSRWTLSAGPEWGSSVGGRVRGEFDMIKPGTPLRLRLEMGGYWEPTQDYAGSFSIVEGTVVGSRQSADLTFGITAALTPLPKAKVAPYVTLGVVARQGWAHGWNSITTPDTNTYTTYSGSAGQLTVPFGLGMRARLGDHMFQVELRKWEHRNTLLVGTSLPF